MTIAGEFRIKLIHKYFLVMEYMIITITPDIAGIITLQFLI